MPAAERGCRPEPHLRRQPQQLRHQPRLRRMHRRDDQARRVLEDHQRLRADAGEPLLRQPLRPVRHPGHHPRHARRQQRLPRRHLPGRQPRADGHANRPRSRVPGRRQATGRPGRELPARRPLPERQPLRVRRQLRHHHNRRNAARQRRHRQDHARLRYQSPAARPLPAGDRVRDLRPLVLVAARPDLAQPVLRPRRLIGRPRPQPHPDPDGRVGNSRARLHLPPRQHLRRGDAGRAHLADLQRRHRRLQRRPAGRLRLRRDPAGIGAQGRHPARRQLPHPLRRRPAAPLHLPVHVHRAELRRHHQQLPGRFLPAPDGRRLRRRRPHQGGLRGHPQLTGRGTPAC